MNKSKVVTRTNLIRKQKHDLKKKMIMLKKEIDFKLYTDFTSRRLETKDFFYEIFNYGLRSKKNKSHYNFLLRIEKKEQTNITYFIVSLIGLKMTVNQA